MDFYIEWAESLHIELEDPNPLMTFQGSAALVTVMVKSPLLLCIFLVELSLSVVTISAYFGGVAFTHLSSNMFAVDP